MDTSKVMDKAEQCMVEMHAAIEKSDFYKFKNLLEKFGSKLSAGQRVVLIHHVLYTAIEESVRNFRNLLKEFCSELPTEQRVVLICNTLEAAIE
jgi:hypothetical protein